MTELTWLLLASRIAGISLVLASTLLLAAFLVWTCFNFLEFQLRRLKRALEVQDIHEFGKEYREWKAERKEQE